MASEAGTARGRINPPPHRRVMRAARNRQGACRVRPGTTDAAGAASPPRSPESGTHKRVTVKRARPPQPNGRSSDSCGAVNQAAPSAVTRK